MEKYRKKAKHRIHAPPPPRQAPVYQCQAQSGAESAFALVLVYH